MTASPLFKLPLEVRIMIYELLLVQKGGMYIPCDTFARRNYKRDGSVPYECNLCGLVFLTYLGCLKHVGKHRSGRRTYLHLLQRLQNRLPEVSTALILTCRLIRLEASAILYSKNTFYFSDPATVSNFRWSADRAQVVATQEIGIKFGSNRYGLVSTWATYLTKRTFSFGQDFPHLRRLTIDLDLWIGFESSTILRSMSKGLRERSPALEWVLVLTLDNEKVLDCFESLVDREDDSGMEVRRYICAKGNDKLWKNALLWWGPLGEAVPQKYKSVVDQPHHHFTTPILR